MNFHGDDDKPFDLKYERSQESGHIKKLILIFVRKFRWTTLK